MSAAQTIISALISGGMDVAEAASLVAQAAVEMTVSGPSSGALRTRKWRLKASQSVTCDSEIKEPENVTERHKASQSVTCDSAPLSKNLIKKERGGNGSRILPEFPAADDLEFAAAQGWSDKQIETEVANFRDYWIAIPGAKGVKRDWPATWRRWVRSSRVKPVATLTTTIATTDTNWRPILESYLRFKHWPRGHGNEPGMASCRAPPELLREFGLLREAG